MKIIFWKMEAKKLILSKIETIEEQLILAKK
jgi:hypothetical protein